MSPDRRVPNTVCYAYKTWDPNGIQRSLSRNGICGSWLGLCWSVTVPTCAITQLYVQPPFLISRKGRGGTITNSRRWAPIPDPKCVINIESQTHGCKGTLPRGWKSCIIWQTPLMYQLWVLRNHISDLWDEGPPLGGHVLCVVRCVAHL